MPETKYRPLQIKQVPTDGSGIFTGLASTYGGAPDHQGDVVERGAFAESILKWRALGDYPPILFNHGMGNAHARIGKITSMHEIEDGLLITAQLNLKNERALEVYEAMLDGSLDQLSIGYATIAEYKRDNGRDGRHNVLSKLDLIEVSIVPVPANPRARVLDVKSRENNATDKVEKARWILKMVNEHPRMNTIPASTWANLAERLQATVADVDSTVDDVRETASAFFDSQITLRKYQREDRVHARRWDDYRLKRDVESLVADEAVTKAQRHQSVDETDLIGLRRHLETKHGNQIASVTAVELMNLAELAAAHRVMHGASKSDVALQKSVDELIASVRAEKIAEEAAREAFTAANEGLLATGGHVSEVARAERDRERSDREKAEMERRWKLRELEADRREAADAIARDRAWLNGVDAYTEEVGAIPNDRTPRVYAEPNVIDATVEVEPDTFRIAVKPEVDELRARLSADELKETR